MVLESEWSSSSTWAPSRMQLYVDDPTVVAWGTRQRRAATIGLLVLWWLVLGIPLSWSKGSALLGPVPHVWIGVRFWIPSVGVARMALPPISSLR